MPETDDKASVGWVCGATFDPLYRDSENFRARHFLTFDYDHISPDDVVKIREIYGAFAHLIHTTWSHTPDAPRLRVWLPLSSAVGYDQFQAVSRAVAARFDIEKMARESHVPSQFMYRCAKKPGGDFASWSGPGPWIDVDGVLAEYSDWTDRASWPRRADGDRHSGELGESPLEKSGVVGAFCRAFSIEEAIERFDLPYDKVR